MHAHCSPDSHFYIFIPECFSYFSRSSAESYFHKTQDSTRYGVGVGLQNADYDTRPGFSVSGIIPLKMEKSICVSF